MSDKVKVWLNGMEVDAKVCPVCKKPRHMHLFYLKGREEPIDTCKDCHYDLKKKGKRKPSNYDDIVVYIDGIPLKKCNLCHQYKEKSQFNVSSKPVLGVDSRCRKCFRKLAAEKYYSTEKARDYYRANREKEDNRIRVWRENNRDRYLLSRKVREARRRTKLNSLPETITIQEVDNINLRFKHRCALTQSAECQLDHFIPISWGVGGTYKGNLLPIDSKLNALKRDRNTFEWAEEMIELGIFSRKSWTSVIKYLAHINSMSVEDFEDYVYLCESFKEVG